MIVCPPKNDPEFKKLVEAVGEPRAYIAFFRHANQIPDLETARAHLARKPAGYVAQAAAVVPAAAVPAEAPPPETPVAAVPAVAPAAPAPVAVAPAPEVVKTPGVGDRVNYAVAGPNGARNIMGQVTRLMADGQIEVRRQEGGYDVLNPSHVKLVEGSSPVPFLKPADVAEVPIEQRQLEGKEAQARLRDIDKALKDVDKRELKLGPYAKNASAVREERASLLEERLRRQAELGSSEAKDALAQYHGEVQRHEANPDEDGAIRKWAKENPIITPDAARAAGVKAAGEIEALRGNITGIGDRLRIFRKKGETDMDRYGQSLAGFLVQNGFLPKGTDETSHFTETSALDRIAQAFNAERLVEPLPKLVEMKRGLVPSAPARAEVKAPAKFTYGPVIEGEPSVDFRSTEGIEDYDAEAWRNELDRSLKAGVRGARSGNRSETRIAVAVQGPDGRVHLTGLVRPQTSPRVGRVERALNEPALQRMGTNFGGEGRKVEAGGKVPALVEDVVNAGFKPIAVIHFDGEPAKIFDTYENAAAFDEAWRSSEKTTGKKIQLPEIRNEVVRNKNVEKAIQDKIDDLGRKLPGLTGKEHAATVDEIKSLYEDLHEASLRNQGQAGDVAGPDVPFRTMQEAEHLMPVAASRSHEFQAVAGRLRNQGGKVDQFAKEFFAQGSTEVIQGQIKELEAKLAGEKHPAMKRVIKDQIDYRKQRIKDLKNASGVTFTPWHIAVAMSNVQNADVGDLVRLLHEAVEQSAQHLSIPMRGTIVRAVEASLAELRERGARAAAETGVPLAKETGAIDLLSESIAQKLAAAGIPDHATIVGTMVRWIKDLYYRTVMAAQKAFGSDPDPKLALDWFENQIQRLVGGDYDTRLARVLDRYMVEPVTEAVRRFAGQHGTPGGLVDYLDPFDNSMRQPTVEPTSDDALKWNIAFRQEGEPGKELDIPEPEARARIDSAASNDVLDSFKALHQEVAADMPWDEFWKVVGRGEDPTILIARQEGRYKGAKDARIGGDRMTKVMDGRAAVKAREMKEKLEWRALRESAKHHELASKRAEELTGLARAANKLEGDFRNAALHEDTLAQKAKDLVKRFVKDYSRGLNSAEMHGDLAAAVRESENLIESDPIPERFQQVFMSLSDGGISIFGYMREIARLDLDLTSMTNREVLKAIRENSADTPLLEELGRNRPLAVALAVLARKNAEQVDQIQLGWLRNMEEFQAIHRDLEQIRGATRDGLKGMQAAQNERVKAVGLRERLKRAYLQKRRDLDSAQARVDRSLELAQIYDKSIPSLSKMAEDAQIRGSGAPSEWSPKQGAEWISMRLGEKGEWNRVRRVLRFNPDGSAVDPEGVRSAIAHNAEWLDQNKEKAGSKTYEMVKRQTSEIANLDVQRKYEAGHVMWMDRWVQPVGDEAANLGHSAGARLKQMLINFQRILYINQSEVSVDSHGWTEALQKVEKSAGITDHGQFSDQVYHPVMYFLGTNPGLEEGPAIRRATAMARARLTKPPAEDFNERFADFLRKTKVASERIEAIAQREGAFVKDPRLKSKLRRAVARGWITAMRGMDGSVVQTISRDMQKAGWRLEMKREVDSKGIERQSVVRATTFDELGPEDVAQSQTEVLRGALKNLFTPGIIQRWLEPFINKGGQEILNWADEPIPQADLQDAWQKSGNDVLGWIDLLAEKQRLVPEEGHPDPKADFRLSVLRQLDRLFGFESKMAYESNQVRSMFDPMGPKPHVIMDARQDDLIPAEHLKFMDLDPVSSRMMLGQVAFHAAFGRNGERAVATLDELKAHLSVRHQEYQSLRGTTKGARQAEAAARGWDYKVLEGAAKRYDRATQLQQKMEGIFGVNNPGGPFNDMRGGMEVLHAMAGQIVDNPKVGLYHVISLLERPFAMKSLGPMTLKASVGAGGEFLKTTFGSFLESLNIHLLHSSDWAKEVGAVQGSAFRNAPWSTVLADIGKSGKFQQSRTDKYLIRPIRMLRYLQQKGVRIGPGEGAREFPRFAAIPGMGVLNTIMQIASTANTSAQVRIMENLISKGIRYFSTHREDYENPSFRFKSGDLVGHWDKGVFDYFRGKTVEYGMGNLEDIVRSAMPAVTKGERLVNKDQVLRLSMMALNELDGASSINTTPSILQSNPVLRIGMPLLRWPLWKMHQAHEGLKDFAGRQNFVSTMRGLGTLAMWNLPMGLSFAFLMDRYDEDLLHKKSNLPPIDDTAMIPIIGPALALTTGGLTIPQNLLGFLARGAKAGNIYGLGADMASQFVAPFDPASGQRQFSLDQRVLVMSQFLNFQQAMRNLIDTRTATWATFWKPFTASLGANGALQAVDLVNNALGLDNPESRLVQRINAGNWLRSAGEEAGIELRGASGGSEPPSATGVWVREMQLAAMAGDRMGFLDAHRKALEAARAAVADDPRIPLEAREKEARARVIANWRGRDPRAVFRFKPTPDQMSDVLSNMDDRGREDVSQAIARYNEFSAMIEPSPEEQAMDRRLAAFGRVPGLGAARARQQNAGLLFSLP